MYHEYGLTQQEIAGRLGVSRSTISRALQRAEATGIVEIRVTVPLPELAQLESDLLGVYPALREVRVAALRAGESPRTATARATARIFEVLLAAGTPTIAVGWGRTLAEAATLIHTRSVRSSRLVDAIGHAHGIRGAAAMDVSSVLGSAFSVEAVHVPAPALVRDEKVASGLLATAAVRHAIDLARGAEVTVISIGAVADDTPLLATDLLSRAELGSLVERGAVGDLLGSFFSTTGETIAESGAHWIGLGIEDLRLSKDVIAVAGGAGKLQAVKGAIATGVVDRLVTDEETARDLLNEAHGFTPAPRP